MRIERGGVRALARLRSLTARRRVQVMGNRRSRPIRTAHALRGHGSLMPNIIPSPYPFVDQSCD